MATRLEEQMTNEGMNQALIYLQRAPTGNTYKECWAVWGGVTAFNPNDPVDMAYVKGLLLADKLRQRVNDLER
jgi:ABC-type phosphate transport system auxiliary subunit